MIVNETCAASSSPCCRHRLVARVPQSESGSPFSVKDRVEGVEWHIKSIEQQCKGVNGMAWLTWLPLGRQRSARKQNRNLELAHHPASSRKLFESCHLDCSYTKTQAGRLTIIRNGHIFDCRRSKCPPSNVRRRTGDNGTTTITLDAGRSEDSRSRRRLTTMMMRWKVSPGPELYSWAQALAEGKVLLS
jgi:hypothetical protein